MFALTVFVKLVPLPTVTDHSKFATQPLDSVWLVTKPTAQVSVLTVFVKLATPTPTVKEASVRLMVFATSATRTLVLKSASKENVSLAPPFLTSAVLPETSVCPAELAALAVLQTAPAPLQFATTESASLVPAIPNVRTPFATSPLEAVLLATTRPTLVLQEFAETTALVSLVLSPTATAATKFVTPTLETVSTA